MNRRWVSITAITMFLFFSCFISVECSEVFDHAKICDFPVFFDHFKKAIDQKNRPALKKMLTDDFSYTFGDELELSPGKAQNVEIGLRYIDRFNLWCVFRNVLSKGYIEYNSGGDQMYISPPDWVGNAKNGYFGPRIGFVKVGNYWRCSYLTEDGY